MEQMTERKPFQGGLPHKTAAVTPEQVRQARAMRNAGMGWADIAFSLGLTRFVVHGAVDPQWKKEWSHRRKVWRAQQMELDRPARMPRAKPAEPRYGKTGHIVPQMIIPERVLEEWGRVQSLPRDPIAELMGDPPRGRSALDRRASR